jgi:N-(2-amino-2-carboxyethyl)-L-glutamate synthase
MALFKDEQEIIHLNLTCSQKAMCTLQVKIQGFEQFIGNTPMYRLDLPYANLYTKLEYFNFFGSIKDRPAYYILNNLIRNKEIDAETTIVESSSGNFAIALAGLCKILGLKFIPVIDPNISPQKRSVLEEMSYKIITVNERDETGGYLLNRIKAVKKFVAGNSNVFNPNQYQNDDNYLSYYHGLGSEICHYFKKLDYAFISVSTGGTLAGVSIALKEIFPDIKIVAVDVEGSMIFENKIKPRRITGIGAGIRTCMIDKAIIDDTVILSQKQIIDACHELTREHSLLVGASAGAAYYAATSTLKNERNKDANALFITPDAGTSYLDTIYNKDWVTNNIEI